jgi:DNA-binding response OmpR family regulator
VAKVLVIDDSRMMRLYLQRCLTKAGFEVEEWVPSSAMEVSEHVTSSAPDLIVSDYQMPGCNGSTLVRMARKANPDVPLLVLTAFKDDEMEAGLLKLGVKRVLTKPIEPESLLEAVRAALETPAS